MRAAFLLFAGLLCGFVPLPRASLQAQSQTHPLQREGAPLFTLCSNVFSALTQPGSPRGARDRYLYQRQILAAAGVEADDEVEIEREKVRHFWRQTGRFLTCDSQGFVPGGGNLVKYAIFRRFSAMLLDLTRRWAVDLNHVDNADGRTVLDWLTHEMTLVAGTSAHATLRAYGGQLRAAGAVNRREIDGIDCTHWPNAARIDQRCPRARP